MFDIFQKNKVRRTTLVASYPKLSEEREPSASNTSGYYFRTRSCALLGFVSDPAFKPPVGLPSSEGWTNLGASLLAVTDLRWSPKTTMPSDVHAMRPPSTTPNANALVSGAIVVAPASDSLKV